jgi:hypothetical protein
MADRSLLRLSTTLVVIGEVLFALVTLFHPGREDPNNHFALNVRSGVLGWVGRFAAVSVVVALALYGVVQAVDGVANKHAVDAWSSAPEAEKAARFASAETMRWLEWGTSSYQTFMFALALILLATVIGWTARVPRPIGYLMGLAAIPYLVQSWVLGTEGFAISWLAGGLSVVGLPLMLAWSIWLLIVAWRMKEPDQPARRPT